MISNSPEFIYFALLQSKIKEHNTLNSLIKNNLIDMYGNDSNTVFTVFVKDSKVETIKNQVLKQIGGINSRATIYIYSKLIKEDEILHKKLVTSLNKYDIKIHPRYLEIKH